MLRVQAELKRLGKTQGDLAAAIGVASETISRWVHGRFPAGELVDAVLAYMRALDPEITYERLFGPIPEAASEEPQQQEGGQP